MFIRKYEPRRATAEEVRRYFLQNYCDAPDALFGSAMEKETYLNAETPGGSPRDGRNNGFTPPPEPAGQTPGKNRA